MFIQILVVIIILSIILSLRSLRKESTKKEMHQVKKDLSKGRVVFQKDHKS